jgi:hypothetical protein
MRFTTIHLDDIERLDNDGLIWRPVRRTLGVTAFGINGYTGVAVGDEVIERHDENSPNSGGHEELYLVTSGRATFAVDGETRDAPVGTLVLVAPGVMREAVAAEPETTVLVIGGPPGAALPVSAFEYWYAARPRVRGRRLRPRDRDRLRGPRRSPRLQWTALRARLLRGDGRSPRRGDRAPRSRRRRQPAHARVRVRRPRARPDPRPPRLPGLSSSGRREAQRQRTARDEHSDQTWRRCCFEGSSSGEAAARRDTPNGRERAVREHAIGGCAALAFVDEQHCRTELPCVSERVRLGREHARIDSGEKRRSATRTGPSPGARVRSGGSPLAAHRRARSCRTPTPRPTPIPPATQAPTGGHADAA